MIPVGDVAGERRHLRPLAQLAGDGVEVADVPRADDKRPAAISELAGEREPKTPRGSGDECKWHVADRTPTQVSLSSGNWS